MRRMYSENQLIALIEQYGGQVTPEDIQDMFDDGEVNLFGKYVRIMDAPSSTTLTDDQIEQIKEGVFIDGDFLGYTNPILCPAGLYTIGQYYTGILIGKSSSAVQNTTDICVYQIYQYSKSINIAKIALSFNTAKGLFKLNGKENPSYPADSAIGQLISRKGVLQYYVPVAQDNITSGDTIALDSDLGKALIDHLEVEINGYRARYEYTSGNYVVYSSKSEADSGAKLQVNMISYNTTNGTLAFNQMTFTPDN